MERIWARGRLRIGARVLVAGGALAALMAVGSGTAHATTRWVNDAGATSAPGTDCSSPGYNSIAAAIAAAAEGDSIKICKGVYVGQLVIDKSIKLKGVEGDEEDVVIRSPSAALTAIAGLKSILTVTGDSEVQINKLTIAGPVEDCELDAGIYVRDHADLRLNNVRVVDIQDDSFSNCRRMAAIRVGSNSLGESGQARINGVQIDGYQGDGILVEREDSRIRVRDATIDGAGNTSGILQYGIAVGEGAAAIVEDSVIRKNTYTVADSEAGDARAAGIVVKERAGDARLRRNNLHDNEINLLVWRADGNVAIRRNEVHDAQEHGIWLLDSESIELKRNEVESNGGDGIRLERADESEIRRNRSEDNEHDGLALLESSKNELIGNTLRKNGSRDAREDNGSDNNEWDENECGSGKPEELCAD